jgi:hypothetical protein
VLKYRSVDVMKWTKDMIRGQPSDATIKAVVGSLASLNVTHIAISVPLDASSDYPAPPPSPRTAEAYTQAWADAIHTAGLHVLFRGDWNGIEGNYGFTQLVGDKRIDPAQWLARTQSYVTGHPDLFRAGDIWAPLPERTEGIFQDATSFLPYTSPPGIQSTYAGFFNNLADGAASAFGQIGQPGVLTGYSANNFSEVASGWLYQSLFDKAKLTSFDYYGSSHTPAEMDSGLRQIYASRGYPLFQQEWADYWDTNLSQADRTTYLRNMYAVWRQLTVEGKLVGFNYWGGWTASMGLAESILNGDYSLNYAGQELAGFFKSVS